MAFDNDEANDWAYGLERLSDLSLVDDAFRKVESSAGGYLEQHVAAEALAGCEVLARLRGRPGYTNAYTAKVDSWVAVHPIIPSDELVVRGSGVIDRILGGDSELREVWEEAGDQEWLAAMADLRHRLTD